MRPDLALPTVLPPHPGNPRYSGVFTDDQTTPGFSLAVFFCLGLVGALAARVSDYRLRVGTLTSTKKMVLLR